MPKQEMTGKRFAVCVGINNYTPEAALGTLQYAENDARAMDELLGKLGFPAENRCLLLGAEATLDAINEALASYIIDQPQEHDLVLFYFAGHSKPLNVETEDRSEVFLAPYDFNTQKIKASRSFRNNQALGMNRLRNSFFEGEEGSRKRLFLFDSCYSGDFYGPRYRDETADPVQGYIQQMLNSKSTGRVALSSCLPHQKAREDTKIGHGYFTYHVLRALSGEAPDAAHADGTITVNTLFEYLTRQLDESQRPVLSGVQHDTFQIVSYEHLKRATSASTTISSSHQQAREKYLKELKHLYGSVRLPIGPTDKYSLQALYQPLTLLRDPIAAEDLEQRSRRKLLGEHAEEEHERSGSSSQGPLKPKEQVALKVNASNSEEALEKSAHKRMVVLGGPGTGKTTTLKHLVSQQVEKVRQDEQALFPIFISLSSLVRKEPALRLRTYLQSMIEEMEIDATFADWLWERIEQGRAFICLDGLDEVDPKVRSSIIDLINRKANEPGNVWIVGSRFTEYKGGQFRHSQFDEWELQAINHEFRLELARQLFTLFEEQAESNDSEEISPKTFVTLLEQHRQALAWGESPLLFSLAAIVYKQHKKLPESRAALYEMVIEGILKAKEEDDVECAKLKLILADLSLWLQENKKRTFTTEDLLSFFVDQRRATWGIPSEMTRQMISSGMLEVIAKKTYGFRHLTFQEYLAAVELARKLTGSNKEEKQWAREFMSSKRTYSRWLEVQRLVLGVLVQSYGQKGLQETCRWLQELNQQRHSDGGDPGLLCFSLALRSLGELAELPEWTTQNHAVKQIQEQLLNNWIDVIVHMIQANHESQQKRLQSLARDLRQFAQQPEGCLAQKINQVFASEHSKIRITMLEIAGELEFPSHDFFLKGYQDHNSYVRTAALQALTSLGDRTPIDPILLALHDESDDVRSAALQSLASLGNRAPIDPILLALEDKEAFIRSSALRALASLGESAPINLILRSLDDKDSNVRAAALQTLNSLGNLAPIIHALQDENSFIRTVALQELGERTPIDQLLQALQDNDSTVRAIALRALNSLGYSTPIGPLLHALQDENPFVRDSALQALTALGDHVPIGPLLHALGDEHPFVRHTALRALALLGDRAPIDPILHALEHDHPNVLQTSLQTLTSLGDRAPIDPVLHALEHEHSYIRTAALQALTSLGDRAPIGPILKGLEDKYDGVRQIALQALASLGDRAPIDPILHAFEDDENFYIRTAALQALASLGDRAPIDPILHALEDGNFIVRAFAIEALASLGRRAPINILLQMIEDEEAYIRATAIEALASLGERAPLNYLLNALEDKNDNVRSAAVRMLGSRTSIDLLLRALEDASDDVRSAAVQALASFGERAPVDPILHAFEDESSKVQTAAVQALASLGDRAPIDPILRALEDASDDVRAAAVQALASLGDRAPIDPILRALEDASDDVRAAVIKTLGRYAKGSKLHEVFITFVGDESSNVRQATLKEIGKYDSQLIEKIAKEGEMILNGQPAQIYLLPVQMSFIADTLGEIGLAIPQFLGKLAELLAFPHWQVQVKAAQALGNIRRNVPDVAIRRLLELYRDKDPINWAVQRAADDALAEILSLEAGIEDD